MDEDKRKRLIEQHTQLYHLFHSAQDKYVYFLLTATIAAIGFTVTQTQDLKGISLSQLPLALCLMTWAYSFWAGARNRETNNEALKANAELLVSETDKANPEHTSSEIKRNWDELIENKEVFARKQRIAFIIGVILFVIWRICEIV